MQIDFKRRAAAVISIAGAIGAFGGFLIQVGFRQASLDVTAAVKAAASPTEKLAVAQAQADWSLPALQPLPQGAGADAIVPRWAAGVGEGEGVLRSRRAPGSARGWWPARGAGRRPRSPPRARCRQAVGHPAAERPRDRADQRAHEAEPCEVGGDERVRGEELRKRVLDHQRERERVPPMKEPNVPMYSSDMIQAWPCPSALRVRARFGLACVVAVHVQPGADRRRHDERDRHRGRRTRGVPRLPPAALRPSARPFLPSGCRTRRWPSRMRSCRRRTRRLRRRPAGPRTARCGPAPPANRFIAMPTLRPG